MQNNFNILASDVSSEAIKWCKQKARERNLNISNFFVMDILNNELTDKYDFIYSVATLHMLVLDKDRKAFLDFIYNHLEDDGKAFISIMGDGTITKATDITKAYNIANRNFGDKVVHVVETSCRIVDWKQFLTELKNSNLTPLTHYVDHSISGFKDSMVVEVVKIQQ